MSTIASAQTVTGKWITFDSDTKKPKSEVEIYEKDGVIFGKITELFNVADTSKPVLCTTCKGDKKDQPIIGMNIIENMKPDGKEYKGGTITDPQSGKTYKCVLYVDPKDASTLVVKGYIGPLNKSQYWKRPDRKSVV